MERSYDFFCRPQAGIMPFSAIATPERGVINEEATQIPPIETKVPAATNPVPKLPTILPKAS